MTPMSVAIGTAMRMRQAGDVVVTGSDLIGIVLLIGLAALIAYILSR